MHLGTDGDSRDKVPYGSYGLGLALKSFEHLGLHFLVQDPGTFVKPESGTEIFGLFRYRAIYKEGCWSKKHLQRGKVQD
jgi:hypothetical protein